MAHFRGIATWDGEAMDTLGDELFELSRDLIAEMGYTLLDVRAVAHRGSKVLRFYVDHDGGIAISDCETISRELSYALDAVADLKGGYSLEVSSPGLDYELTEKRDYEHFAGRQARLVLRAGPGEESVLVGTITGSGTDAVRIRSHDGEERSIPLAKIARARLVETCDDSDPTGKDSGLGEES